MRVPAAKNDANRFLFQNVDIYLYPIPLGVADTLKPENRVIIIYTSQNIKPLRYAVGQPNKPPLWRSCFQ